MTARARNAAQDVGVPAPLDLFELVAAATAESSGRRGKAAGGVDDVAGTSSTKLGSLRAGRDARAALPRLCVKPDEAARMLGVSRDYFDEHIKPEIRIIRHGARIVLVPIAELVRWVERNAARWG
jgi:hypothetical protein